MPNENASAAPVLQTERLILRGHTLADFDECAAVWADPLVTRYIGGRPFTEEESWARVLRYGGMWPLLGYGYWAVRERDTGRYVGDVGLADFHRDVAPPLGHVPEAGWVLATWAHGRGFGTEAVRAVLAWSDAHLDAPRTVCIIALENAGSLRVAQKCGFGERERATYKGDEIVILERPRP
ncbi:MAG TPA: GNAT family N-acetyltransferase [Longimicrobium sp.]|nr:GNAT family N-acetyltransferase [Longimicrobium sp.]